MSGNEKKKEFFSQNSKTKNDEKKKLKNADLVTKSIEIKDTPISLISQIESVTILGHLIDEMTDYSVQAKPKEAIGLLGGNELRPQELQITKILYVSVGDETSVSFSEEDFDAFEKILNRNSYCLGWWHSHPGYGLFLSQTDISTHIYSFQLHNEQSIALVIEPTVIGSNGRAAFQCYQVVGEKGKTPFNYKEIASFIQE
ncbi:MAG: Mov34/MPN/PAD-1 family protein [Candidatus Hodarchaeota archaeon]